MIPNNCQCAGCNNKHDNTLKKSNRQRKRRAEGKKEESDSPSEKKRSDIPPANKKALLVSYISRIIKRVVPPTRRGEKLFHSFAGISLFSKYFPSRFTYIKLSSFFARVKAALDRGRKFSVLYACIQYIVSSHQ